MSRHVWSTRVWPAISRQQTRMRHQEQQQQKDGEVVQREIEGQEQKNQHHVIWQEDGGHDGGGKVSLRDVTSTRVRRLVCCRPHLPHQLRHWPTYRYIIAGIATGVLLLLLIILLLVLFIGPLRGLSSSSNNDTSTIFWSQSTTPSFHPGGAQVGLGKWPSTLTPNTCSAEDVEPVLCQTTASQHLCDTQFAMANCCRSCSPIACYDAEPGCYKIKLYGLCVNDQLKHLCCASCKL